MKKIGKFEIKFGFVNFNGKDFILKELMKPTGQTEPEDLVEMSADAIDDEGNAYIVYWKCKNSELSNPNYDKVDRIEAIK